jgi:hypothetical protein
VVCRRCGQRLERNQSRLHLREAARFVYQLLREEGLFLGLSSGINVAGAVRFARESGPGQKIVTVLCDSGHKYQSTLFNRDWLASNHLDPDLHRNPFSTADLIFESGNEEPIFPEKTCFLHSRLSLPSK